MAIRKLGMMRYQLVVRLTSGDVGGRVVIRWRRPAPGASTGDCGANDANDQITDVLGVLEAADENTFQVRKGSGELVVIPRERALAGKVVPSAPPRGK
ncbi:MAG TPA: hypothetical protein VG142_00640 [Trebonia sp.]|jgi:hypothetical protein|nr:hypothetical protein [Trebonia sp.]